MSTTLDELIEALEREREKFGGNSLVAVETRGELPPAAECDEQLWRCELSIERAGCLFLTAVNPRTIIVAQLGA